MGPRFKVNGWMRELTYEEYLQTAQWWRTRERIVSRAGGVCEHCLANPSSQVHHKTYDRLGHEDMADLVALCDPCHLKVHKAELPPIYPYSVSGHGWPFPFAVLAIASMMDPELKERAVAAIPPELWPSVAKTMLAIDIEDLFEESLERARRLPHA